MQLPEIAIIIIDCVLVARLLFSKVRLHVELFPLFAVGCLILLLGFVLDGLRWQMIPAWFVFFVLSACSLSSKNPHVIWRGLAAVPLVLFLGLSAFLSHQLPIFVLPSPSGPYSVGTFDTQLVDRSRIERFNPTSNRELGMAIWYPSNSDEINSSKRASLWESLYTGDWDIVKFFTHYLSKIKTSSYKGAPIAQDKIFPVVIFNHGMTAWPEQNTVLVEQLASHGYVVVSIAHTYQSTRVQTKSSGKVLFTSKIPDDLGIEELDENGNYRSTFGVISQKALENGQEYSLLFEELYKLYEQYISSGSEDAKRALVVNAIKNRERYRIGSTATANNLYNLFYGRMTAMGTYVDMWVEDIQFVLDQLAVMGTPLENFDAALDLERVAILGHSIGGSAAGEFCKTDSRCKAGVQLDGNYSGFKWDTPLRAPFMVFYSTYFFEGNNFAYLPSENDLWNYTHPNLDHMDFTDLALAVPNLTAPGMSGTIAGHLALNMVNDVTLAFLDRYLKNQPRSLEAFKLYPELVSRKY